MSNFQTGVFLLGLFAAKLSCAQALVVVGEATLVIGKAQLMHANGLTSSVTRGTAIQVGDLIQTEMGGHVHLRFVDGGRVSVRPLSRLQVENYSYSDKQPQLSAIKFNLQEGVVRSITGTWGEAARERFRLNTPLAAIGIKGTDFVVRANADVTAAAVFAGAISVAPLQGICVNTLGPCAGSAERLLSEDMKGQMVELVRWHAAPRLVPVVDLMAASLPQVLPLAAQAKTAAADGAGLVAAGDKPLFSEVRMATAVTALGADVANAAHSTPSLSWARFPWAHQLSGDDFSRQFEIAMLKNSESLGGSGAYTLLRQTSEGQVAAYSPLLGKAQFQLASAAGSVIRDNGSTFESVQFKGAALSIDFAQAVFATQLQVTGPQLGGDTVQVAGSIGQTGLFQVSSGNSSLQGGLGDNGREAGYAFQKGVPGGMLSGVTLWGR